MALKYLLLTLTSKSESFWRNIGSVTGVGFFWVRISVIQRAAVQSGCERGSCPAEPGNPNAESSRAASGSTFLSGISPLAALSLFLLVTSKQSIKITLLSWD